MGVSINAEKTGRHSRLGWGEICVTINKHNRFYYCTANGTADDQPTILAALEYAAANMPASVEFGPGDFGMHDGIILTLPNGSRGLSIFGQGGAVSRFVLTGGAAAFTAGAWHCIRVTAESAPTYEDYANYIYDVSITKLGAYDDDPLNHASSSTQTASMTSGGYTVTLSGTNAYAANGKYIRVGGAGVGGKPLTALITAGGGTTSLTVDTAASATVSGERFWASGDPAIEETHAFNLQYVFGGELKDNFCYNIGDQSFEVDWCENVVISGNVIRNTSAAELDGGPSISVKNGCKNITVTGNVLDNTGSDTRMSSGIAIKMIIANPTSNVVISNNTIRNYHFAGIEINHAAATTVTNTIISDNIISGSLYGIYRDGNNIAQSTSIMNNIISGAACGIAFDVAAANNLDVQINFNTIRGAAGGAAAGVTIYGDGILCNGTDMSLSGNHITDCIRYGIYCSAASNVVISGGLIDNCDSYTIEVQTYGFNVLLDGVKITNAVDSNAVVRKVETVRNCDIKAATLGNWNMVADAKSVVGCSLNGGIRLYATTTGGLISGNYIKYNGHGNGDAIELAAGNDYCVISGNHIDTSNVGTHRYCIDILAGADSNVITSNVCISDTATAAIRDAGTGNTVANNIEI